jgi:hypothetical protein
MICINCIILLLFFKLNYFSIKKIPEKEVLMSLQIKQFHEEFFKKDRTTTIFFFNKIAPLKNHCKNSILCEDMHVLKDEIDYGRQMRTCPFVLIMH